MLVCLPQALRVPWPPSSALDGISSVYMLPQDSVVHGRGRALNFFLFLAESRQNVIKCLNRSGGGYYSHHMKMTFCFSERWQEPHRKLGDITRHPHCGGIESKLPLWSFRSLILAPWNIVTRMQHPHYQETCLSCRASASSTATSQHQAGTAYMYCL